MTPPLDNDKSPSLWPLALLGILLFALWPSKRNQSGESISKHDNANRKNPSAPAQSPFISNVIPTQPNENSSNKSQKGTPLWEKLAVLTAIGLLIVNFFQMRATQDAVEKSRDANDLTRDGLYSVQRAFIINNPKPTVEVAEYAVINGVRRKKPLKLIEFTHHWENVGNTPAIGIVTAVGKVMQKDEITEQEFITTEVNKSTAKSALGPKAILDSGTLRDDESFFTDDPDIPRSMWGWIVYRDIFPESKSHVTEWCWRIDVRELKWKIKDAKREDIPHITGASCVLHNCVDEFCEDYANITALSPAHE